MEDISELQEENEKSKGKVEVGRANLEGACHLLGVDVADVDLGHVVSG